VHPLFRLDQPLPVPPGQSPFHIRGLYYNRLAAHLRDSMGRDWLDVLDDPRIRDFINQRFSWTGWYDVLPAMPICAALARSRGLEFEYEIRERTRRVALGLIPSAFRLALRVPGAEAMAAQIGQVVAMTMDFVQLGIEESKPTRSTGWGRGVPLYIAPHTANTVVGFFQAVFEARNGTSVTARYTDVVEDGERFGFKTVSIRYEFDWSVRSAIADDGNRLRPGQGRLSPPDRSI